MTLGLGGSDEILFPIHMEQPPIMPATTAPPARPPSKKGLSPIAWVGIGCGGVLLLIIVALIATGMWGMNKAKELGLDFENDPDRATAELVVSMSPDLEKISSDEEAGTITIRTKDGKVMTLTYTDIKERKFMNQETEVSPAGPTDETPDIE